MVVTEAAQRRVTAHTAPDTSKRTRRSEFDHRQEPWHREPSIHKDAFMAIRGQGVQSYNLRYQSIRVCACMHIRALPKEGIFIMSSAFWVSHEKSNFIHSKVLHEYSGVAVGNEDFCCFARHGQPWFVCVWVHADTMLTHMHDWIYLNMEGRRKTQASCVYA